MKGMNVSIGKTAISKTIGWKQDCGLHPLIHTLLEFNLAQDVESIKKAEQVAPQCCLIIEYRLNF
jgi:hypothetical protein